MGAEAKRRGGLSAEALAVAPIEEWVRDLYSKRRSG